MNNLTDRIRQIEDTLTPAQAREAELSRYRERLNSALFGWDDEIESEPDVIFINNCPIASLGNISLGLGVKKSGKSTFQALLLGDRSGVVKISLPCGRNNIVYADNEQSGKYIRKLQDRIVQLYGSQPGNIQFLKLRKYSKKERLELIRLSLECIPDVGLLIIDNIKDVCADFNDLNEADKLSTLLIQWAQKYNIHIMCVLHLNKGNGLSRGHLGSELENKAETVLKIRKDEQQNLVYVEPEATRGKPFEKFAFYFDENGIPIIQSVEALQATKKAAKGKVDPWEYNILTHTNLLEEVFKKSSEYGYAEMWQAIKNIAQRHSIYLGNNTAISWLTYYKTEGLVGQNERRKYVRKEV